MKNEPEKQQSKGVSGSGSEIVWNEPDILTAVAMEFPLRTENSASGAQ